MRSRYKFFDQLSKSEKLTAARQEYRNAVDINRSFLRQAKKAYKFYAGHQYTTEELRALEEAGRPALVANIIKATVELVKGVNDLNRVEAKAIPTEPNDQFLADILNDTYGKVRNIENVDDAEDDAFENLLITGKGYIAVDLAPDPKRPGEIRIPITSIPVDEVYEDPNGRYVFWEKWISVEDFAVQYPEMVDELDEILHGESNGDLDAWDPDIEDEDYDLGYGDTPSDEDYSNVLDDGFYDLQNGMIKIVHKEYWAPYDRYYGVNPFTGQLEEFDPKHLKALKERIPNFEYTVVKDRKVKWFQFIGHKVLYDGDSPLPFDGFSIVSEVAYKDKSGKKTTYFGIVKDMIDPQREINKRWSQTLNLILAQTQGGYFVEKDAIEDVEHWDETRSAPGADTIVANNALAEGRLMPKNVPQLPSGVLHLNEFAQDLAKKISGVNPDLLGYDRGRQEPGIVLQLRQRQGLTLLNNLFRAHKRLIKRLAERVYAIIAAYMPESQIKRILGGGEKYVFRGNLVANLENKTVAPLRNLKDLKYNIDVIDSPANMTKTMSQLAIFLEMMSKGFPVDPLVIIDKLDLTAAEKAKWKQYVQSAQQLRIQTALAAQQAQAALQQGKLQLEKEKIHSKLALDKYKTDQDAKSDDMKFAIELAKLDQQAREKIYDIAQRIAAEQVNNVPLQEVQGGLNG